MGRGLKTKKAHILLKAINAWQDEPQNMKALVEYMDFAAAEGERGLAERKLTAPAGLVASSRTSYE